MRLHMVVGAAALIIAVAASIAVFYLPHGTGAPTPSPGHVPVQASLVTEGVEGGVSVNEARELLSASFTPAFMAPIKGTFGALPEESAGYLGGSQEAGTGYDYTGTNVQVPGVDEGDVLKLAPPYAIYLSRGTLFLLRLWPAQNMSIIDSVSLASIAYSALVEGGANVTSDTRINVYEAQALVAGNKAVIVFSYMAYSPSAWYECGDYQTITVGEGGRGVVIKLPACRPRPWVLGTVIAVFSFGDEGLAIVDKHLLTSLRLIDSRMSSDVAYVFLKSASPFPTGEERVDGVDILEAGPTYVAGTSRLGNTLLTVVALDPSTGEIGVTNIILPITAYMSNVIVYMRDNVAYILAKEMRSVSEEKAAEAIIACAPKAPKGLREGLESIGPNPGPDEVLGVLRDWAKKMEEGIAPIAAWVQDTFGTSLYVWVPNPGNMSAINIPEDVEEAIKKAVEEGKQLREFSDCVTSSLGRLSAFRTEIVKVEFSGVSGAVKATTAVPGEVLDRFGVEERGGYLYVVTTDVRGVASFALSAIPIAIIPPYIEGSQSIYPLLYGTIYAIQGLHYLSNTSNLSDLFMVMPWASETGGSSVYVLRASDLSPVSSLTGIAPGERVYAARYVGDYLYVVTFRRVDPLFAIDISNPAKPRILGWLKMPGYSEYLHPWGDRYLVGVGVGESWGLKVDLYDVSDPTNITRVSSINVSGWSQALWEHHAFQPIDNETFAIPLMFSGRDSGIAVFQVVPGEGLRYLGSVDVKGPQRSARINEVLYAFGYDSVVATSLPGLEVIKQIQLFEEGASPGVTTVTIVETTAPS